MTGQHLSFPSVPAAPWAKSLLGCSGCSCHNNKMMQQFPLLGMQEQRQRWGLGRVSARGGKSPSGTKPSVVMIVPTIVTRKLLRVSLVWGLFSPGTRGCHGWSCRHPRTGALSLRSQSPTFTGE